MSEYAKIPPKPITDLVYNAKPIPAKSLEMECSWLGRWADNGWSIRIEPRLAPQQWVEYRARSSEGWDDTARRYDPLKSLELLVSLFPTHNFAVSWPKCGKRIEVERTDLLPLVMECGEIAKHTETHLRDTYGKRVALARCDKHQGKL